MWDWLSKVPGRIWLWMAGTIGGLLLLVSVFLSGRSVRKGTVDLAVAKRELEKANDAYSESVKKTAEIQQKQKRLVSDILAEQLVRAEQLKRVKGLTDEQVVAALRASGDITDDGN